MVKCIKCGKEIEGKGLKGIRPLKTESGLERKKSITYHCNSCETTFRVEVQEKMPNKHIIVEVTHPQVVVLREAVKEIIEVDNTDQLISLIAQKAVGNFVKKYKEAKK